MQHVSPYLAMGNNPVNLIDPTGRENIGGYHMPRDGFSRMNFFHEEYQEWLNNGGKGTYKGSYPLSNTFDEIGGGGYGGLDQDGGTIQKVGIYYLNGIPVGIDAGGGFLADDFKAVNGFVPKDVYDRNLVKNGGEWGYWKSSSSSSLEFDVNNQFNPYLTSNHIETFTSVQVELKGSVDYGKNTVSSNSLKSRLLDFSHMTGNKIIVVGGDRSILRNDVVGGSRGSRHLVGDAVDIVVPGTSNRTLAISAFHSGLFNTTIYYPNYQVPGALPPHIHLDMNPDHNNALLIYKLINGENKYSPWNP